MADFTLTASDDALVGVDDPLLWISSLKTISDYSWDQYRPVPADSIALSTTGVSDHTRALSDRADEWGFKDDFNRAGPDLGPDWGGPSVGLQILDGVLTPTIENVQNSSYATSIELATAPPVLVTFDFRIPGPLIPVSSFNFYEIRLNGSRIYIDSRGGTYGGAPGDWVIWTSGSTVGNTGVSRATFSPTVEGEWWSAKVEVWGAYAGDPFRAKLWRRGDPEPEGWTLDSATYSGPLPYTEFRIQMLSRTGTYLRGAIDNFFVTPLRSESDSIRHVAPSSFVPEVLEGFDAYTPPQHNDQSPAGVFDFYQSFIRPGGRGGSLCAQSGWNYDGYGAMELALPSTAATRVYGCAFKLTGGTTNSRDIIFVYGSPNPWIRVDAYPLSGAGRTGDPCRVQLIVNGAVVGTSMKNIFNEWHHVCLKLQTDLVGRVILMIDDEVVVNTTLATQTTGPAYHGWVTFGSGQLTQFDDIYVGTTDDASASTGDMWGDVRIVAASVAGAGGSADWTPYPSGPNWQAVSETFADEDASYVRSETAGEKDLYVVDAIEPLIGIRAVGTSVRARRSGPGSRTMRVVTKSGGTEAEGPVVTPRHSVHIDSYTQLYDPVTLYPTETQILTEDPATSASWEQSALDAIQVGMKIEG